MRQVLNFNNKNWPLPIHDDRLRLIADENATFYLTRKATNSIAQYSIDGSTWADIPNTYGDAVSVSAGDTVYLRGKLTLDNTSSVYSLFKIENGAVRILGNIMYWYDYEHPESTTLVYNGALRSLFLGCTTISSISELELPATTLASNCYKSMFASCSNLTTIPSNLLPATTLAGSCYSNMFISCISLTNVPALPATTLDSECYNSMFNACSNLTTIPSNLLPATTLANKCYYTMFKNCTNLVNAPELPATTLETFCYGAMFQGCTSLTTAPELPATTLVNDCYSYMFLNCTSLTTAPELPATTLANNCYYLLFYGCSNLNLIKCLATNISATASHTNWLRNVAETGTFIKAASMSDWPSGASGIPSGWTVQDAQ